MKYYDYEKALKLLEKYNLKEITLGMANDLFWTATTMKENELKKAINKETEIAGISGSRWATPIAIVETPEGKLHIECYIE